MSERSVITIGNFDGVHKGHQQLLSRGSKWAKEHGCKLIAMTFDPHPVSVLKPELAPGRLCTLERKKQLLLDNGADEVVILKPNHGMLDMQPEKFAQWLADDYKPVMIVEGDDFRFGYQRKGDIKQLRVLGETLGFGVDEVETCEVALSDAHIARVSSSLIRWLLEHGRVADVEIAMGRPFVFESNIVKGKQVGRTLGFPTINLDLEVLKDHQIPAFGVYGGKAIFENGETYTAAISIGIKPTFEEENALYRSVFAKLFQRFVWT